jgi:RNA polymerase sigma-70 factor (ECF subfamily)
MDHELHDHIASCFPRLRILARHLARDRELADDLVQEAILRVLTYAHHFERGTNFEAWVATILRNCYYTEMRRKARASRAATNNCGEAMCLSGGQEESLRLHECERAYRALPAAQREAMTLVVGNGLSYQEASEMAGCAPGTVKSRISRARVQLQRALGDEAMRAVSAN